MDKIDYIIREVIDEFVRENCYPVNEYYERINASREKHSLLPYNKYEVSIFSNDHNPPHLHIKTTDGWNIKFRILDGQVEVVENCGKKRSVYKKLLQIVPSWLNCPSALDSTQTNKGYAIDMWNKANPQLAIEKPQDCFIKQQK